LVLLLRKYRTGTIRKIEMNPLVIRLCGSIDTVYAQTLEQELMKELDVEYTELILDFTDVTFIASSGLRVLLKIGQKANKHGVVTQLRNLNDVVAEVMKISGFDRIFKIL